MSPIYGSVIEVSGYTSGTGEGYYTHQVFVNYCPQCGHYDTLDTYVKGVNELTCLYCDADYSFSGKDKSYGGARGYLTIYEPEPQPVPQPEPLPEPAPKTQIQIYKELLEQHELI